MQRHERRHAVGMADVAQRGASGGDGASAAYLYDVDDQREEEEAPKGDQHARGSNSGHAASSAICTCTREATAGQHKAWQPRQCSKAQQPREQQKEQQEKQHRRVEKQGQQWQQQRQLLPRQRESWQAPRPTAEPTVRWAAASVAAMSASMVRWVRMGVDHWARVVALCGQL